MGFEFWQLREVGEERPDPRCRLRHRAIAIERDRNGFTKGANDALQFILEVVGTRCD
jgi:hypothetical protein